MQRNGAPDPVERHPEFHSRGEPLVPLLRIEEGLADPGTLATWHDAVSSALSADVRHDLLGLWLYPPTGGAVLLGPENLAEDHLPVPLPTPQLEQAHLAQIEAIVGRAGYGSVVALPIRFGKRDVGLMLVAALEKGCYDEGETVLLGLVGQRLAPLFGRLGHSWTMNGGAYSSHPERIGALLSAVADANAHAGSPQLFLRALSRAIDPLLPHDHLELLVADADAHRYLRLGEHCGGPVWADPSLVFDRDLLDVEALFTGGDRFLLTDACADPRWPRGYFTAAEPAGAELRSVVGTRLARWARSCGFLLAGSVGPGLYGKPDADLLAQIGGLIAPQAALWAREGTAAQPGVPLDGPGTPAGSIAQVADTLATLADLGEAIGRVAQTAAHHIPFDHMRCAIRLREGDRVVLLEPGERRPLPDLPLIPVAGTTLGQVLQGESPNSFTVVDGEARLIVPLRVAARVHGALVLTASYPALLREIHVPAAQELADVVAPHLELLRRAALLPPPYSPGWKKVK